MSTPYDNIDLDASIYAYAAMLLISWIQMIAFIVYMIQSTPSGKRLDKELFLPINRTLLGILSGFIIHHTSEIFRRVPHNLVLYRIGSVTSFLGLAGAEYGTLIYSWIRSKGIIELLMPNQFKKIRIFVNIVPFLLFSHVVSSTANQLLMDHPNVKNQVALVHFICTIISGLTAVASDTLFVSIFIKYLRATQAETHVIDAKFSIIAKYGLWAMCLEYVSFVLFLVALLPPDLVLSGFLMAAGGCCMNCVGMVLVYIKVKIQRLPATSKQGSGRHTGDIPSETLKAQWKNDIPTQKTKKKI